MPWRYGLLNLSLGAFILLGLALLLAGCGGDHYQKEKIGHGYSVVEVPYHGRTIDCIMRSSDTKDGYTVRSLSCDFVAFHGLRP